MVKIKTVVIILKILANFIVHRNFDKNNNDNKILMVPTIS